MAQRLASAARRSTSCGLGPLGSVKIDGCRRVRVSDLVTVNRSSCAAGPGPKAAAAWLWFHQLACQATVPRLSIGHVPIDSEWISWPAAAELVGCPVPTIDWYTRTGRITTRPFNGPRPTLRRESVEEFSKWWAQRQGDRSQRRRQQRAHADSSGPPEATGWLDTTQAGLRLGVSREHVPWLVTRGALRGVRNGQRWWVQEASVDELRDRRQREREQWVSCLEAATTAGCSPQTILSAAKAGVIEQRHLARGSPSLSRASVESFAAHWRQRLQERERAAARKQVSAPPDDGYDWLTAAQTADMLGLSRRRVDQLAKRESLPFVQAGHLRWFRRDHIDLVKRARGATDELI
jgi:hypothetical protein